MIDRGLCPLFRLDKQPPTRVSREPTQWAILPASHSCSPRPASPRRREPCRRPCGARRPLRRSSRAASSTLPGPAPHQTTAPGAPGVDRSTGRCSFSMPRAGPSAPISRIGSEGSPTGAACGLRLDMDAPHWRRGLTPRSSLSDLLAAAERFEPRKNLAAAAAERARE